MADLKEPCTWEQSAYEENYHSTSCGNDYIFFRMFGQEDTPHKNKFMFCPFCGSPIKEVLLNKE